MTMLRSSFTPVPLDSSSEGTEEGALFDTVYQALLSTTLILKHFPLFKTQFVRDAHAFTVAHSRFGPPAQEL